MINKYRNLLNEVKSVHDYDYSDRGLANMAKNQHMKDAFKRHYNSKTPGEQVDIDAQKEADLDNINQLYKQAGIKTHMYHINPGKTAHKAIKKIKTAAKENFTLNPDEIDYGKTAGLVAAIAAGVGAVKAAKKLRAKLKKED